MIDESSSKIAYSEYASITVHITRMLITTILLSQPQSPRRQHYRSEPDRVGARCQEARTTARVGSRRRNGRRADQPELSGSQGAGGGSADRPQASD